MLYECLTGVVPFPKDSEAAVLYAHMAEDPPTVTDQRPELPATLDEVIHKGMAKDPAERYPSSGALLLEANRTFTRRTRAAFTPPRPIEAPQETGIRSAEADVSTRQSAARAPGEISPGTRARPRSRCQLRRHRMCRDRSERAGRAEVGGRHASHRRTSSRSTPHNSPKRAAHATTSTEVPREQATEVPRERAAPPRRAGLALAGTGLALAAVVGLGFVLGRSGDEPDSGRRCRPPTTRWRATRSS